MINNKKCHADNFKQFQTNAEKQNDRAGLALLINKHILKPRLALKTSTSICAGGAYPQRGLPSPAQSPHHTWQEVEVLQSCLQALQSSNDINSY